MARKLTPKERKFVKGKVEGKPQRQAYLEAGYAVMKKNSMDVAASKVAAKPHIQQAIEEALQKQGATPEFAVQQLVKIATQDEEMGAKRLASMNILELHGWNKADRPTIQLDINNAFFGGARKIDNDQTRHIEAEQNS